MAGTDGFDDDGIHELERGLDHEFVQQPSITYEGVKDFNDAVQRHGYSAGDRIPHREMVVIRDSALKDLEASRQIACDRKQYMRAKGITEAQAAIHKQFQEKQHLQLLRQQEEEMFKMDKSASIIEEIFTSEWDRKLLSVQEDNEKRAQLLNEAHRREEQELRRKISKLPRPRNRMSMATLNTIHMEKHMSNNHQYRDAKELHRRLQLQLPKEKARFEQMHKKKMERMWIKLRAKHDFEKDQLFEKNKAARIKIRDARAAAFQNMQQRILNNKQDLTHALRNEMNEPSGWRQTIRPSVAKRKNYYKTTSTLRGSQILTSVSHARLDAPQLATRHEF